MEHFHEAVQAGAAILLTASVFHFHIIDIPELKNICKSILLNIQMKDCNTLAVGLAYFKLGPSTAMSSSIQPDYNRRTHYLPIL